MSQSGTQSVGVSVQPLRMRRLRMRAHRPHNDRSFFASLLRQSMQMCLFMYHHGWVSCAATPCKSTKSSARSPRIGKRQPRYFFYVVFRMHSATVTSGLLRTRSGVVSSSSCEPLRVSSTRWPLRHTFPPRCCCAFALENVRTAHRSVGWKKTAWQTCLYQRKKPRNDESLRGSMFKTMAGITRHD